MSKYTDQDVYIAKLYMQAYKSLIEIHEVDIGIIGRFFEKLFGTNKYDQIENKLKDWYSLTYSEAYAILNYTGNNNYIYDPYFKKRT